MGLRDLASTVMDLAGALLLVAALAVLVWRVDPAAGLAVAGAGVLLVSWSRGAADRVSARRKARRRAR